MTNNDHAIILQLYCIDFYLCRIRKQLSELKEIIQNQSQNSESKRQLPVDLKDRLVAVERKIARIEKRLTDTPTAFDLARDFTWYELKNLCVKV